MAPLHVPVHINPITGFVRWEPTAHNLNPKNGTITVSKVSTVPAVGFSCLGVDPPVLASLPLLAHQQAT